MMKSKLNYAESKRDRNFQPKKTSILEVAFLVMILLVSCQGPPKEENRLTSEEVEEMVAEAYFHTFPIVENYKALYAFYVDKNSPRYQPMNKLVHSAVLYTPEEKFVVSPNNDTFYSTATLDLRAQPIVLKVPEITDRYYSFQFISMVTDNFFYVGSNTTGTGSGIFAITSPDFEGELPEGVQQIAAPSEIVSIIGRTGVNADDPKDVENAKQTQAQYELVLMSEFYPEFQSKTVEPINFPTYQESDKENQRYFELLNFLLQYTKPNEKDAQIIASYDVIGVRPGEGYPFYEENPQFQEAILSGIKKGIDKIETSSKNFGETVNGWTMFPLGDYFGDNFTARTNIAKIGIYANSPFEAYYPLAYVDSDGQILDGSNTYAVTFPKGEFPPAKYFWSLTMYDNENQLLVENEIKRYSIGDRTQSLKPNADGSLTIYLGHQPPPQGTGNWLPAPDGGFNVMMRIYGPEERVLDGTWKPVAIQKLN
jgi:hypothetical protein